MRMKISCIESRESRKSWEDFDGSCSRSNQLWYSSLASFRILSLAITAFMCSHTFKKRAESSFVVGTRPSHSPSTKGGSGMSTRGGFGTPARCFLGSGCSGCFLLGQSLFVPGILKSKKNLTSVILRFLLYFLADIIIILLCIVL